MEEVKPDIATRVDLETNCHMDQAEDAGPDTDVTAQIRTHRVRATPQDVPWPRGQRGAKQHQRGVGRRHAELEPYEVGSGQVAGQIEDDDHEKHAGDGEADVPLHATLPVGRATAHALLGQRRTKKPRTHARSSLSRQPMSAGTAISSTAVFRRSAITVALYRALAEPAASTAATMKIIRPTRLPGSRNPCRLPSRHRASPNMIRLPTIAAIATPRIP